MIHEVESKCMQSQERMARFEATVLPHLDTAYNLARWLTRADQDAEDVVQEAFLRAYKFFDGFHGGDSRSWVLMIVRNTCYSWLRRNRMLEPLVALDDKLEIECTDGNPEEWLERSANLQLLEESLAALPVEFREVIVLRELESLSYKEIAYVTQCPLGTIMSRLARGRRQLRRYLLHEVKGGIPE